MLVEYPVMSTCGERFPTSYAEGHLDALNLCALRCSGFRGDFRVERLLKCPNGCPSVCHAGVLGFVLHHMG
jgi:hypothetical protein